MEKHDLTELSLDLNPLGHIWDEQESKLCAKSVNDITHAPAAEWEQITAAKFLKSCGEPSQRGTAMYQCPMVLKQGHKAKSERQVCDCFLHFSQWSTWCSISKKQYTTGVTTWFYWMTAHGLMGLGVSA